jgi:hypothetical protein
MPSNQHRADRIELMLMAYRDPDDEAALTDLLADAMHYCCIHGKDFALAMQRAETHFAFERQVDDGGEHE